MNYSKLQRAGETAVEARLGDTFWLIAVYSMLGMLILGKLAQG